MNQIVITSGPIAGIGHNQPPDEPAPKPPTPFQLSKAEIDGLYLEAKNWADGSKVETQEQADAVGRLIALIRTAETTADERRIAENKPFDDGKAEVQARYAELIADTKSKKGMTVMALAALQKALTPFLVAKDLAQQKEAEAARAAAQVLADAAQAAVRAASGGADLEAKEAAEDLLTTAKKAESVASKAEAARPMAKGVGRSIGLRTTYRPEIINMSAFSRWCLDHRKEELVEAMMGIAKRAVASGLHTLPGIKIIEEKGAV